MVFSTCIGRIKRALSSDLGSSQEPLEEDTSTDHSSANLQPWFRTAPPESLRILRAQKILMQGMARRAEYDVVYVHVCTQIQVCKAACVYVRMDGCM